MKFTKNIQAWLVLTAFLATVIVLFGGQAILARLKVNNPLKKELATFKVIKDYQVEPVKEGLRVNLKLSKTENLQEVLDKVKEKVELYHQKPVTGFNLQDRPNQNLINLKYQLSFYLEEARASGEYVRLKSALEELNKGKISAKVYLSEDYLYLQLEEGPNYLYQAIPRSLNHKTVKEINSGGESA